MEKLFLRWFSFGDPLQKEPCLQWMSDQCTRTQNSRSKPFIAQSLVEQFSEWHCRSRKSSHLKYLMVSVGDKPCWTHILSCFQMSFSLQQQFAFLRVAFSLANLISTNAAWSRPGLSLIWCCWQFRALSWNTTDPTTFGSWSPEQDIRQHCFQERMLTIVNVWLTACDFLVSSYQRKIVFSSFLPVGQAQGIITAVL